MTPRERVLQTISHKNVDRVPCNYIGTPEVDEMLKRHFGVDDMNSVLEKLGVDLRIVDTPYVGPQLRTWSDARFENYWGQIRKLVKNQAGSYNEAVEFPYAQFTSLYDVEQFRWPRIEWFDFTQLEKECKRCADYAIVFGAPGNMDLINGIAYGRGVEQVIVDIATEDPIGMACMQKRFKFCYERSEKALKAANGLIDILWIGDDYGTQNGLLMSPTAWRKLFFPKLKAMCDLGHKYGAKVMLHSCGATRIIWPDLIEAGVDIYDTVQPEAKDMNPAELKTEFADRICFHGTVSTQKTLPFGTVEDVIQEVRSRVEIVGRDGGLIIAPAHNIQPDTPIENIVAMYSTIREFEN